MDGRFLRRANAPVDELRTFAVYILTPARSKREHFLPPEPGSDQTMIVPGQTNKERRSVQRRLPREPAMTMRINPA
jgi:hypothetical protein